MRAGARFVKGDMEENVLHDKELVERVLAFMRSMVKLNDLPRELQICKGFAECLLQDDDHMAPLLAFLRNVDDKVSREVVTTGLSRTAADFAKAGFYVVF